MTENSVNKDESEKQELRADRLELPRLELRWRQATDEEIESSFGDMSYACDYGIVLPVNSNDCRSNFYDEENDFEAAGLKTEIFYKFSTTLRGSSKPPSDVEKPFRDGVHAEIDALSLGGLQVWVRGYFGSLKNVSKPRQSLSKQEGDK